MDNRTAPVKVVRKADTHYMGVGVRHAGDDGVAAYRIPGLATSNKGTLLGVYDVRHNNSADLQEYVEIGLSRSTDGGQTWERCVSRCLSANMKVCQKLRMVWETLLSWWIGKPVLSGL